jgi:hypothetical protein
LSGRRARIWGVLGILSLTAAGFTGVAGAQTEEPAAQIPILEARVEEQDASLREQIGEISAVGAELEEAQTRVDSAQARASDLGEQTRELERERAVRRQTFETAKAGYEEKAQAAYKGGNLQGLSFLLDGLLGSTDSLADPRVAEILFDGRLWRLTGSPGASCTTLRARSRRNSVTTKPPCRRRERKPKNSADTRKSSKKQ